jgi:REP element-mobilizing transposase RayT
MYSDPLATLVTTTSFGSRIPGDIRGYVDNGQLFPSIPKLAAHVRRNMKHRMIQFSLDEQDALFEALQAASAEFNYELTDAVVEATHLHWIIGHNDKVENMVGRLKTRLRQRLNGGRIWTEGFSHRLLFTDESVYRARQYLTKHAGLRLLAGELVALSPGRAGGF